MHAATVQLDAAGILQTQAAKRKQPHLVFHIFGADWFAAAAGQTRSATRAAQ